MIELSISIVLEASYNLFQVISEKLQVPSMDRFTWVEYISKYEDEEGRLDASTALHDLIV